jgi:hypothetical protein
VIYTSKYIGNRYGTYEIIGVLEEKSNDGHKKYIGRCLKCGELSYQTISNFKLLNKNNINKCIHYTKIGDIKVKTSLIKNTRLKKIFSDMLRRCYDINNKDYKFYGKNKIKVFDAWIQNPALFEEWALNSGYKNDLTIDRIDSSKSYCPDNCRWIDLSTNSRFKANTNYITATVTLSGKQWAKLIPNIGINRINTMLRNGGYEATVKFIEDKLKNKANI